MPMPSPAFRAAPLWWWYGTSPAHEGEICLAFADETGAVHRFRIALDSAAALQGSIRSQSSRSSGRPASAGFSPVEGQKVAPPTKSSNALITE